MDTLLKTVGLLPLDAASAVDAALRRTGLQIGPMDTLIAGTAIADGATLVTHNLAEFRRIRGLRVEDWF